MTSFFSLMSHDELIKELVLLTEVRENIQHLMIYNPELKSTIGKIDQDLRQIKRHLFFQYVNHKKLDLEILQINVNDLQMRMRKYLE